MEKKTFEVSGMKCEHCKANVENALTALNGVVSAQADLEKHQVTVAYDETAVRPAAFKQAVDDSGSYELTL